jgi:hypothetical protein
MNTSLSVDSLIYAVLLPGMSFLAHHLSPHAAGTTLWVGIAGGVLSAVLGVIGLQGYPIRRWAIVAMTVLSIVLLEQTVTAWLTVRGGVEAIKSVALILTVLLVLAVGQLVNLIQNRSGLLFKADSGALPDPKDE